MVKNTSLSKKFNNFQTTNCANLFFPVNGKENICNIKNQQMAQKEYYNFNNCNQYKCKTPAWSTKIPVNGNSSQKLFNFKLSLSNNFNCTSIVHKQIGNNTRIHPHGESECMHCMYSVKPPPPCGGSGQFLKPRPCHIPHEQ